MTGQPCLLHHCTATRWRAVAAALSCLSLLTAACSSRDHSGAAAQQPGVGQPMLAGLAQLPGTAPPSRTGGPATALAQGFDGSRESAPMPASDALLPPVMHGAD